MMRSFFARLVLSMAAISGGLTSCISPPAPLPPGTQIQFINAIPAEVTIAEVGLASLLQNRERVRPVPELSSMMRRVVMEEAQIAGLKCVYAEVAIPRPRNPNDQSPYMLDRMPSQIQASLKSVTMVAFPGPNVSQMGSGTSSVGFAIEQQKHMIPALSSSTVRGSVMVRRYENPSVDKRKWSGVAMAGFGEAFKFRRIEGDTAWGTAMPVDRNACLEIWEMYFRQAVSQIMGRRR